MTERNRFHGQSLPLQLATRAKQRSFSGSGSLEKDSPVEIGAMEKEEKTGGRSIMTDLEKDNVMRTKRARRCRSVVFQRSTWAVSPVSRAHGGVLFLWDHGLICCPERRFAVTSKIALWNAFPQPLAPLFTPVPNCIGNHLLRLAAEGNPASRNRWLF
jgi:hypothetical protein